MPTVVARLPAAERDAFTEPLGELYQTPEPLLSATSEPVIAVGDVVLAHLGRESHTPAVSIVDGRTERGDVSDWVLDERPDAATEYTVKNRAGTITAELVEAIESALEDSEPARIIVDGEEDLAVLPVILLAPTGATVVYGQPSEGMVAVQVDDETRATGRSLLARMDRDPEFWEFLG
ncbi:GTP-dependent dephospho-CoA kinase family protein [Halodesulfurarchaeum sp.]|uniref:GTP-dependent dephospho-CoA kinase family protein n=1 Tax=Halodesulfurarchaeum sp. TaxID=1980530 RepID=UPI002FC37164